MKFPFYTQPDMMDCGVTSLKMVAEFYGKVYSFQYLREITYKDKNGVSLLGISDAAEKIGFQTIGAKATFEQLENDANLPCIVHWRQDHFVVVVDIKKRKDKYTIKVADPGARSILTYTKDEFCRYWCTAKVEGIDAGIILLLNPKPEFYEQKEGLQVATKNFSYILRYLIPYKKLIIQLFLGLLVGSAFSLITPFLTQALVDYGINQQNVKFVYLILGAQLLLFCGLTVAEVLRSWILLHISSRVHITIVSVFLAKMMRLPIAFFDTKNMGDILQRIRDNQRIKLFLTSSSLNFMFSLVNLLIFGCVLVIYSVKILIIFIVGSTIYYFWVVYFLKRRRQIDYKRFNEMAKNQSNEVQLIQGMQEIKLQNAEKQKRWEWESIQVQLFKIDMKSLSLAQTQSSGANFINEIKNIIISFYAAKEVIDGNMTIGMMMAVSYILGQLNSPVLQLVNFTKEAQDAKMSIERMSEIHEMPNEDRDEVLDQAFSAFNNQDITIRNLCFRYGNPNINYILDDINLTIPYGKTIAIVGASGSGKTTLLKLLLKFYEPENGEILLGGSPLKTVNTQVWRSKCGVVMQDGFMFSDTIAKNIAVGEEVIDKERLFSAVKIANIKDYIEKLPLNYNTKIGSDGLGLSIGQKQRILIARAVYKNPDFLFFDEATSALDANNEKEITQNISEYSSNRTTLIIAHRLSTVKNADHILVLDQGRIAEFGTHKELTEKRGLYYDLVKNQLELGS